MSERQEKKRRYNQNLEYIADFNRWLNEEPPLLRAVNVLKEHCYNQSDCTKCIFHDGKCKLAHTPPCWWKI